ncbi:MAG: alpha/beta fold hydrolase [Candidatus Kariarchaeaceae archaeon]|jgi:dienelactone hydrolase
MVKSIPFRYVAFTWIAVTLILTLIVHFQATQDITYEIVEFSFSGETFSGTFALPEGNWDTNELPGVVVFHGYSSTKEMMRAFVEGLARNNMAVLAIDVLGHGHTSGGIEDLNARLNTGNAAISFLKSKDMIDENRIGLIGHSMGGAIVLDTASRNPDIKSNVILGNPIGNFDNDRVLANSTHPANLMVGIGKYDELVSVDTTTENFETMLGISNIDVGHTYGNFSEGTARKLVITNTNHIFEVINQELIEESIKWVHKSLFMSDDNLDPVDIDINGGYFALEQFLSLIAALFWLGIPVIVFFVMKSDSSYKETEIHWLKHGSISLFAFAASFPFISFLPAQFAGLFAGWLFIGGFLYAYRISRRDEIRYQESLEFIEREVSSRSIALGLLSFLSIFLPIQLLLFYTPWDFRYVLPILSALNIKRFGLMAIIWVFGTFFFTYEIKSLGGKVDLTLSKLGKSVLARNWPYLLFLFVYYIPIVLFQENIFPEFIGIIPFFLVGFVPVMIIISILSSFGQYLRHSIMSISILCAGIVSWLLCSTVPYA